MYPQDYAKTIMKIDTNYIRQLKGEDLRSYETIRKSNLKYKQKNELGFYVKERRCRDCNAPTIKYRRCKKCYYKIKGWEYIENNYAIGQPIFRDWNRPVLNSERMRTLQTKTP